MSTSTTSAEPPSKLKSLQNNATYLLYGSSAGAAARPASLTTRSILTTSRYILRYLFWRVVRYGKYALLGAVATTIGGSALAAVSSGAAMLIAPSFMTATALGIGWAVAKVSFW